MKLPLNPYKNSGSWCCEATLVERFYLYPNVKLGKNVRIGSYVVIGHPPKGKKPGELETVIEDNSIIRSHTVIYAGTKIGAKFQTGHAALIREENFIGEDVVVGSHSVIERNSFIGNHVRIHSGVFIPEYTVIEDGVFLAPNCVLTNDPHPRCGLCLKGPLIRKNTRIGANVTILPHVEIGQNSLIGAGSVVTRDIPPNSVAYGVPARVIKRIDKLVCKTGFKDKPYHLEDV